MRPITAPAGSWRWPTTTAAIFIFPRPARFWALSLHDALPIYRAVGLHARQFQGPVPRRRHHHHRQADGDLGGPQRQPGHRHHHHRHHRCGHTQRDGEPAADRGRCGPSQRQRAAGGGRRRQRLFSFFRAPPASGLFPYTTLFRSTGQWGYTLDNSKVQFLGAGITTTDKLTVTSADHSASQDIVITITGTTDAATHSGTASRLLIEDDAAHHSASGQLAVADDDSGYFHFSAPRPLLGSFPTRRSSDLPGSGATRSTIPRSSSSAPASPPPTS